ncbi:MAG: 4Fe-4S dicluster domain-containing protein [Dehalococcoidales bacterium]|nr:4Fe-4S dicluster domain-containing protein [Dehalococcoidales bacterium]
MSINELFWTDQLIYIQDVFLPVIIGVLVFAPLLAAAFIFGFGRSYRLWKLGQPDDRSGNFWQRLFTTLSVAIANIRIVRVKEIYPGIMHALIFGGAAILVLGKIIRLFSYVTGITNPPQAVYLYASCAAEIGGVLLLVGGILAVVRRFILRPTRLDNKPEDSLIYVWIFLIVLTGFMVKGYRIAASETAVTDWASWSPVGYLLSHIFPAFLTEARDEILVWHRTIIHTVPAFILLGYIWVNRSRLQHILLSPLNIFFRSLKPKGALNTVDFETTELFGVSKIEEYTWKQLMDLDACTRCGRCQDVCPANFSGKALSPKQVILDLKEHLYETYPAPWRREPVETRKDMIAEVITDEVIWDCTTCRACMQACPVYIEHVDKIVDMRRNLAMEQSRFPEDVQNTLKSLGARGHPFRGTTATRTTWYEGLEVPDISENSEPEILYWVGCTGALEDRNMSVPRAMVSIMKAAGVNFAILGEEESCCGDPARRMGDEYLFQTICQANIEILKSHDVMKIVTACPHCFNTLKHEYPQFGGNFKVVHHTQFILDLLRQRRLKLGRLDRAKIAYHDSCYLGRYNDIYEEPRLILSVLRGINCVELGRCRSNSFCCGGGGGHMWMEEDPDKRVNNRRVDEIIQAKVDIVATACPYCLTMFEDGVKAKEAEETLRVKDLSELIAEALEKD